MEIKLDHLGGRWLNSFRNFPTNPMKSHYPLSRFLGVDHLLKNIAFRLIYASAYGAPRILKGAGVEQPVNSGEGQNKWAAEMNGARINLDFRWFLKSQFFAWMMKPVKWMSRYNNCSFSWTKTGKRKESCDAYGKWRALLKHWSSCYDQTWYNSLNKLTFFSEYLLLVNSYFIVCK